MQIKQLVLGPLEANSYIVEVGNEAVIIDPGFNDVNLENWAKQNAKKIKYILLTHSHGDHICGAEKLRKITNAPICVGQLDADAYNDDELSLVQMMGGIYPSVASNNPPDILLKDGDTLSFSNKKIHCLHTPGHTLGGMCYIIETNIFTGDTLFNGTVGRTDFEDGNFEQLKASLKKILDFANDVDYTIYSGHGPSTTLSHERRYNPYLVIV